jgi:hypothetical protein
MSECLTLAEAKAEIATLRAALASGHSEVSVSGRTVKYADMQDRLKYLSLLCRDLQRAAGKPSVKIATWSGTK